MTLILKASNVSIKLGNESLINNGYFQLETGSITALFGKNGVGKTSVCVKLFFSKIEYSITTKDGKSINEYDKFISYLPQHSFIPPNLKISKIFNDFNCNFDDFNVIFPDLNLDPFIKAKYLSKGTMRLIEFYIVINHKSLVCLLDEPFSNIAPIYLSKIKELILEKSANKAILIIDHNYQELIEICQFPSYIIHNKSFYQVKSISDLVNFGYLPPK
jgi:ABC-type multidrug transport system ATPase subunit